MSSQAQPACLQEEGQRRMNEQRLIGEGKVPPQSHLLGGPGIGRLVVEHVWATKKVVQQRDNRNACAEHRKRPLAAQ